MNEMSSGRTKREIGSRVKEQEKESGCDWRRSASEKRERTIENSPDTQTCGKHVCTCADIHKLFAVKLFALLTLGEELKTLERYRTF